jgi:hypothetical protein
MAYLTVTVYCDRCRTQTGKPERTTGKHYSYDAAVLCWNELNDR